nr:hypothetical protein Iba_chr08fCG1750 [Ipomoea batatas]
MRTGAQERNKNDLQLSTCPDHQQTINTTSPFLSSHSNSSLSFRASCLPIDRPFLHPELQAQNFYLFLVKYNGTCLQPKYELDSALLVALIYNIWDRFYWFLGNTVAKNELLFFGQQFRIIKRPVTDPRYIPLYTRANDLLLSETGTHFERRLFIAGMATPWNRENGIGSAESNESYQVWLVDLEALIATCSTRQEITRKIYHHSIAKVPCKSGETEKHDNPTLGESRYGLTIILILSQYGVVESIFKLERIRHRLRNAIRFGLDIRPCPPTGPPNQPTSNTPTR